MKVGRGPAKQPDPQPSKIKKPAKTLKKSDAAKPTLRVGVPGKTYTVPEPEPGPKKVAQAFARQLGETQYGKGLARRWPMELLRYMGFDERGDCRFHCGGAISPQVVGVVMHDKTCLYWQQEEANDSDYDDFSPGVTE